MSQSGREVAAEHAETFRLHLALLWKRQDPLPRRAGKPNMTSLAAACGFDRGVFYSNEAVSRQLDAYEKRDRIRFYDKLQEAELNRDKAESTAKYDRAVLDRIIELEALVQSQARELGRLRGLEKLMCSEGVLPP